MSGPLDNRSIPSLMPVGSFRRLKNLWVPAENTLARRYGWEKFLSSETYNNEDLHDQLLALQTYYGVDDETVDTSTITTWPNAACEVGIQTRDIGRQPITMLHSFISTFGSRALMAGAESWIAVLNENTGNWRLIADGKGRGTDDGTLPRTRFYCSVNLDTAIFTNNYDKPLYWIFGSGVTGCDMQAARTIPDLDLIGLTKAAVTWTWKYVTFLANVEMDGQRKPNKIVWSDYQNPLSYDPAKPESIAGETDLDYGEEILGGAEIGDYFFIFTNKRIWQLSVRPDGTFNFNHRYSPDKTGDRCLFYRNTLISTGDEIYYFGSDGLYAFSIYRPQPERLQKVHLATGNIFHESRAGTISPLFCDNHVAGYNSATKEVLFSWVPNTSTDGFPESTFVFNTAYAHCSEIDHGFTAFCSHQPDSSGTLRDYLLELCACNLEQLADNDMGFTKEGLPMNPEPDDCPEYSSLYSTESIDVDGSPVEDYEQEEPSDGAFCSAMQSLEDLCGLCPSDEVFIGACALDYCLKQFSAVYSRERCTNPTVAGTSGDDGYTSSVGTYVLDGYQTQWVTMAMNFKNTRQDKVLHRVEIEAVAEEQTPPSNLVMRIGMSHQVADPVLASSRLRWETQDDMPLEFLGISVAAGQEEGSRPSETYEWPTYYEAMYFYLECTVNGTGGGFQMSRITADIDVGQKANPFG